jgi:hypothetical protein
MNRLQSSSAIWLTAVVVAGGWIASCALQRTSRVSTRDDSSIRQVKEQTSKNVDRSEPSQSSVGQVMILATSDGADIELRSGAVVVLLRPMGTDKWPGSTIQGYPLGNRRLLLVLKGIRASKQPGVLFHLYLDLPPGTLPGKHDQRHVGVLNFFDAVPPSDFESQERKPGRDFSYDITDVVDSLRSKNLLTHSTTVTIIATRDFPIDSCPLIGQIAIAVQ